MLLDLNKESVISRVLNATAAGSTDVASSSVDMAAGTGFDFVTFIACLGTLTATQVTKLLLEHSDDNSSWSAVTGGATAVMADGDSNKMLIATYKKPTKRYVRVTVDRGTANAVIDSIVAIQYNARSVNTTQSSTVSQVVAV